MAVFHKFLWDNGGSVPRKLLLEMERFEPKHAKPSTLFTIRRASRANLPVGMWWTMRKLRRLRRRRMGMRFMPNSNKSDETLLKQFRGGEHDAATQLYARYASRLLDLAQRRTGHDLTQRVDPEDVVQSVFRTFFRRAAEGSYEVPDGDTLWKLLMVIALNKIRSLADFHRADKRDVRRTQGMLASEGQLGQHDSFDMLRLTIEDLTHDFPEAHRQMIQLRIEGYSVAEIAEKVARSKRSTERVLQSFRSHLMNELKQAGVEDLDAPEADPEKTTGELADDRDA